MKLRGLSSASPHPSVPKGLGRPGACPPCWFEGSLMACGQWSAGMGGGGTYTHLSPRSLLHIRPPLNLKALPSGPPSLWQGQSAHGRPEAIPEGCWLQGSSSQVSYPPRELWGQDSTNSQLKQLETEHLLPLWKHTSLPSDFHP